MRDRVNRRNVLLLGLDRRDSQPAELSRSDAIILASLDRAAGRILLVSFPRDLWVPIPARGEERLNAAHRFGGPELVRQTLETNFGVRVDHVVTIDFRGFERMIDALGGVTVEVEYAIADEAYPDEAYGYAPAHIAAGSQRMDGRTALQYVRSRHTEDDFGRSRRQQRLLQAIAKDLLRPQTLQRLPELISLFRETVRTDLSAALLLELVRTAVGREPLRNETVVIDYRFVQPVTLPGGAQVLLPDLDAIRMALAAVLAE